MGSFSRFVIIACVASLGLGISSLTGRIARADDSDKPIRALLVTGGCCHDYAKQKEILTKGISARANVEWVIAFDPDRTTSHLNAVYQNDDWAKGFDVIVHDECSADVKDLKIIDRILKPHRDGLPGVVLHCAMHCYRSEGWNPSKPAITPWFEFTGLATTGHGGAQIPIEVTYLDKTNPILAPLSDWTTIHEELYNNILGDIQPTATALAKGKQTSKGKDGVEHTTRPSLRGPISTTAKPASSAPRSATTTKPLPTPATSTW